MSETVAWSPNFLAKAKIILSIASAISVNGLTQSIINKPAASTSLVREAYAIFKAVVLCFDTAAVLFWYDNFRPILLTCTILFNFVLFTYSNMPDNLLSPTADIFTSFTALKNIPKEYVVFVLPICTNSVIIVLLLTIVSLVLLVNKSNFVLNT